MTKHTPGPWELCDEGDYGDFDGLSQVILGDDRRLCAVHVSDDETRANARLIAAAPELLKALKWAMRGIPKYAQRIKGQNEGYCDGWDAAHAAIAKAEGLAPESTNSSAAPQPDTLASSGDPGSDAGTVHGGRE